MKNLSARNVVTKYCSIAKFKEIAYSKGDQVAATHIFGAQQLAVYYWSELGKEMDIHKVIAMIAFHEIKDVSVPDSMVKVTHEFNEDMTLEARFAHFCLAMEGWLREISIAPYAEEIKQIKKKYYTLLYENNVSDEMFDQLCEAMTKWVRTVDLNPISHRVGELIEEAYFDFLICSEDLNRVLARYCVISELKDKIRMGWNYWNVNIPHREVVSEHAFGTQPLAWLVNYYGQVEDVNINKVVFMMALHETEESVMPDFTPYDPVTSDQVLLMGKKAVKVLFDGLKRGDELIALLDEFNAKETPEGKFAYFCDKLECLFRIKRYSDLGLCSIEGGNEIVLNDPEIQKNISKGAKTVAELFIMHEMPKYIGTFFEEIANNLKTYDASK